MLCGRPTVANTRSLIDENLKKYAPSSCSGLVSIGRLENNRKNISIQIYIIYNYISKI